MTTSDLLLLYRVLKIHSGSFSLIIVVKDLGFKLFRFYSCLELFKAI